MRELSGLGTKGNRLLLWKLALNILDKGLRPGTVELSTMSQGLGDVCAWILPEEQYFAAWSHGYKS